MLQKYGLPRRTLSLQSEMFLSARLSFTTGSRSCLKKLISDPGPHPCSSGGWSLQSSQGVSYNLYTLNDYQRFEALVSLPLSGDQKPSHLINRMLALLPDDYKPISSSEDCFFDTSLSTFVVIFSARRFQILELWLWRLTNSTRVVSLLLWWISSLRYLMSHYRWTQFLPTLVLLSLISQEDLRLQLQLPNPLHCLVPVGSIRSM